MKSKAIQELVTSLGRHRGRHHTASGAERKEPECALGEAGTVSQVLYEDSWVTVELASVLCRIPPVGFFFFINRGNQASTKSSPRQHFFLPLGGGVNVLNLTSSGHIPIVHFYWPEGLLIRIF